MPSPPPFSFSHEWVWPSWHPNATTQTYPPPSTSAYPCQIFTSVSKLWERERKTVWPVNKVFVWRRSVFSVVSARIAKSSTCCVKSELWAENSCGPNNELTQLPHKLGICRPPQTQICFSDQVYCFWHVHKYLLLTGYQTHQWKALTESLLAVEILISEIVLYSSAEIRTPIVDQHTGMKPALNCHTHSAEREIWAFYFGFLFWFFLISELFVVGLLKDLSMRVTAGCKWWTQKQISTVWKLQRL